VSSEEYEKKLREDTDAYKQAWSLVSGRDKLTCPRCGLEGDSAFHHYEFCRIGLQIQRDGYVVGWEKKHE